jgi:hypothetical protein
MFLRTAAAAAFAQNADHLSSAANSMRTKTFRL